MKIILMFTALLASSAGAFAECPQDVGYLGAADMLPPCNEQSAQGQSATPPAAIPVRSQDAARATPSAGSSDDKVAVRRQDPKPEEDDVPCGK
jgi:hypothetical protein